MLMDILGISMTEAKEMDIFERTNAVNYCWNTYTSRRVDYAMSGGSTKPPIPPYRSVVPPRNKSNRSHYTFRNDLVDNYVRKEGAKA